MQDSLPKQAVVYIRYSSDRQFDGDSINRQTRSAEAFCKSNGYSIVRTILDEGESAFHGFHLSNGNLGKFLHEAEKGMFPGHVFLFEELSRLSRQGVLAVFTLVTRLLNAGLTVRDIASNAEIASLADLNKPEVALVMSVNAVVGAMHSGELSRKILAARASERARAAKDGLAFTARCPAWCTARLKEKPKAIPAHADTVRLIFDWAGAGLGAKAIVRRLILEKRKPFTKKWTAEYVTTILCNRAVLGYFQPCRLTFKTRPNGKQFRVRVPVGEQILLYPAVVTISQWNAARASVDGRNRVKGKPVGNRHADRCNNVLAPLVYDATLGRIMNFYQKKSDPYAYLVTKWEPDTKSNYIRYDRLEKAFLKFLEATDWKAVAGHGKTEEERVAENALEDALAEAERSSSAITRLTAMIEEAEAEGRFAGLQELAARIEHHKAKLLTLRGRANELRGTVEAARARSDALHSPAELLARIAAQDTETRLALKTQIAKRVSKIEVYFAERRSPVVRCTFTNGCTKFVLDGSIAYDPAKVRAFLKSP
jgi:DNA invertase Pin-like site-specific DNA recombinase